MSKKKTNYVLPKQFATTWKKWLDGGDGASWEEINMMVYKICMGVSLKFTHDDIEREEIAHDAFVATIDKIGSQKLKYEDGRGSAFNLVTTAAIRHIQSRKNRETASKRVYKKYIERQLGANEELRVMKNLYRRHDDSDLHDEG